MVLVRRRELDLDDLVMYLEYALAHLPQCLLQSERMDLCELLYQDAPHVLVGASPRQVTPRVPPMCRQRGRQDTVVRLGEGRVLVLEISPELRAGRLQHGEVSYPRDHPRRICLDGDDRRTHLPAAAYPRVIVLVPANDDSVPRVFVDLDPRSVDGVDVVDEMPAQIEGVVLDLADPLLLGEREAGVLLRVGGQHLGLVAGHVRVGEVAAQ